MANILGIDYGGRRIGLALASTAAGVATPLKTLLNDDQFLHNLKQIIAQEGVEEIVVGLPRNLDGNDTAQTALVREFASSTVEPLGLPFYLQDEAGTSQQAKERLLGDKLGVQDKGKIDAEAASIILQDYIDGKKI